MRYGALMMIACLALALSPLVNSNDLIKWQTYHRPPGIIKIGNFENQGFIDKVLSLVIAKMPDYSHQMPTTSLARSLADIKAGKNVCHPALHVTDERKKHMYFSQPALINPINRLVGNKANFEKLLVNNNVIADRFPRESTFALIKDRNYSSIYDEFLANQINSEKQIYITSETIDTIFQLVASERVDFTIAYLFELKHFQESHVGIGQELVSYKIEGAPAYTIGSVACPKTPWGKTVITRVDEVLEQLKPTEAYHDALTTWWEHERGNKEFQQFYQNVFLKKKNH